MLTSRGNMRRKALYGLPALLVFLFAIVALAQPKKGATTKEKETDKKAAGKEEKKEEKKEEGLDAAPPTPSAGDDLGEPPPKGAQRPDERTKPSPLNPRANEFPDGGVAPPPAEYDRLLG